MICQRPHFIFEWPPCFLLTNAMCINVVRRTGGSSLSALAAALCLVISFCGVNSRMTATEPQYPPTLTPVTYAQQVNRTLTIGQVTVELHYANHSGSILEVHHSYRTTHPSGFIDTALGHRSVTRAGGSPIEFPRAAREQPDVRVALLYDLGTPITEEGERLDISLGSYIIPAPEVTATALIEFDPDFGKSYDATLDLPGATKPLEMPINTEFQVANRQYLIEKITVFPIEFRMEVVPVNAAARKIGLLTGGVTMEDDTGGKYRLEGGASTFDDENPKGHVREQFIFSGIIPDSTQTLTLTVRGGDEIVGPFVFEDVYVSYETIKPTPTPTPTPVPTATPEPTPTPTPLPSLAVQNLRAEVAQGTVTLSWDAPAAGDVQGYQILKYVLGSTEVQAATKLVATATSYVDSDGLQAGVGYGYTVRTIATGVAEETETETYIKVSVP